ncbi:hypothetical protein ACG2LH_16550 [Zhouia sp. PK063]|uniref:hypothetical protein n=1 Tax=Zhouia sp. PK063 TaxID=3373602 RepID=UPI0037A8CF25
MKAEIVSTILNTYTIGAVIAINYDLHQLVITYEVSESKIYNIIFEDIVAFKMLNERDMLGYWKHSTIINTNILKIVADGWLDQEKNKRSISSQLFDLQEFLIKGIDDCVCVLSERLPRIEEKYK